MSDETTVLLVDDEPAVLQGLALALRREPYRVVTANSGQAALEVLRSREIAVLVADQDMPGMTGVMLLEFAARLQPELVGIMLTGHARLDVALQAINAGEVYRFYTKPIGGAQLAAAIRDAVTVRGLAAEGRRRLRREESQEGQVVDLERDEPGITRIETTATGAIVVREPVEDVASLLAAMERQERAAPPGARPARGARRG